MIRRKDKKNLKREALYFTTQFKPTIRLCIIFPFTFLNAYKFYIDSKHTKVQFPICHCAFVFRTSQLNIQFINLFILFSGYFTFSYIVIGWEPYDVSKNVTNFIPTTHQQNYCVMCVQYSLRKEFFKGRFLFFLSMSTAIQHLHYSQESQVGSSL